MQIRTILFSILLLTAFGLHAQELISSEEMQDLLEAAEIQLENPVISNFSVIRQIEEGNDLKATQNQQGNLQNSILVNQDGTGNSGLIEQNGSGLETKLWQYKTSNDANLWSEGENVKVEVKQDGNHNSINSFIENYFLVSRSAYLLQQGNNNRIELALFGNEIPAINDAQQVQITQTGNDHSVEAMLENSFAPISITQTPGVNGEGMQVNISNSAFSFPTR
ncbi:hypothetical protein [uncultured Draconibacterium sp.]|uniref:hypothetical protein n=1 Tax=uncultured Draconibacterium sp. TaxID=1573823 RepID=UPI0029C97CFB|nr:hypothetical protein [uncultured Draconibacterium sp.]